MRFFSVKSFYSALEPRSAVLFPKSIIWSPYVPTKVVFFFWLGSLVGQGAYLGSTEKEGMTLSQ